VSAGESEFTRSRLDALTERAKSLGAAGLVWMRVRDGGALESPVAKFLSEAEQIGLIDALGAQPGDLVLIVAGDRAMARSVLGQLRLDLGARRCSKVCSSFGSSTSRCSKAPTTKDERSRRITRSRCRTPTTSNTWSRRH
jgi:aspartyl-tRNA synthetase